MTLSREQMLAEMGISPLWRLRAAPEAAAEAIPIPSEDTLPVMTVETGETPVSSPMDASGPVAAIAAMDWDELARAASACRACALCERRKQAVLGVGDRSPQWLFVGEGPGAEEDARGEPFVGQAGKLLDNMLAALDLRRGEGVYIANAVKCRPEGNRTPEPAEMAACKPFLERQIALLQPRLIVLLGRAAVHAVLGEDRPLGSLRGRRFEYRGIPVVVTYHPAYLLRNLPDKAKAWEDLLFARRLLGVSGADRLSPI